MAQEPALRRWSRRKDATREGKGQLISTSLARRAVSVGVCRVCILIEGPTSRGENQPSFQSLLLTRQDDTPIYKLKESRALLIMYRMPHSYCVRSSSPSYFFQPPSHLSSLTFFQLHQYHCRMTRNKLASERAAGEQVERGEWTASHRLPPAVTAHSLTRASIHLVLIIQHGAPFSTPPPKSRASTQKHPRQRATWSVWQSQQSSYLTTDVLTPHSFFFHSPHR